MNLLSCAALQCVRLRPVIQHALRARPSRWRSTAIPTVTARTTPIRPTIARPAPARSPTVSHLVTIVAEILHLLPLLRRQLAAQRQQITRMSLFQFSAGLGYLVDLRQNR